MDAINSIETLHCRAAKIIFRQPKDMASTDVLSFVNYHTVRLDYNVEITELFFKAYNDLLPEP